MWAAVSNRSYVLCLATDPCACAAGALQHVNLFAVAQEENEKRDAGNAEYAAEKAQVCMLCSMPALSGAALCVLLSTPLPAGREGVAQKDVHWARFRQTATRAHTWMCCGHSVCLMWGWPPGTSNPQQGSAGDVNHNPWWTQTGGQDDLQVQEHSLHSLLPHPPT